MSLRAMQLSSSDIQQGVEILLLPKNVEFLERVHHIVATDPNYLFFHASSCGHEVRQILWTDLLYVPTTEEAISILEKALRRYTKNAAA